MRATRRCGTASASWTTSARWARVIATLLALYHRDRTGTTQAVAGSLLGGGVLTGSETYLDAGGKTVAMPVLDHEQTGISPGVRILPVTDGWIAIAATIDDELAALCTVAGVDAADDAAGALAHAYPRRRARRTPRRGRAVRAGATRPVRLVLRVRRQRRRRDDRAVPAHRLRRRASSRARSGPSATST